MPLSRRLILGSLAAASLPARRARAQTPTLKLGVLTDLSGPYKDLAGPVSVACAHQAVEDFGVAGKGFAVEIVSADHQNKPDVAAGVARQWFDRDGVDFIVDVPNSACGLAVAGVAADKNKVYVNTGAGTSDLTGAQCNANSIHWAYDTTMLAKSTGGAMVGAGGSSWFFITADYVFGHTLQREATEFVTAAGGKVLGAVTYPFPGTTDFSSLLLQGQSSGAKVIGLANAGADTVNSIKQAHEFGLAEAGIRLAGLLVFITDVHSLGLDIAQGLVLTDSFYWDQDDRTRAFADRLAPKAPGWKPSMVHAGTYAATLHYLKAAAAMGVGRAKVDGAATVAAMKAMPTEDDCFGKGSIRVDGLKLHPSYLRQVKKPADSHGPWDLCRTLATTPADQAFRPLGQGGCKLVHA